jgi:acid phosphatase class B
LPAWALERRPKPPAVIVDLDETLCTQFDVPVPAGVALLAALPRTLTVHYVTARPEASRRGTEAFLLEYRLPGFRNLHFCPQWQSSREHKREANARLVKEFAVLASIGDADEDRQAAEAVGVRFVRVSTDDPAPAWAELAALLAPFLAAADELGVG